MVLNIQDSHVVKGKAVSELTKFVDFLKKQNVVGLAVGVIIGGSATKLVASLVENIINPILGLFLQSGKAFSSFTIGPVKVGAFINSLIDFLIIMAVVYFVIQKAIEMLAPKKEEEKK